jgi:hypothetical protein
MLRKIKYLLAFLALCFLWGVVWAAFCLAVDMDDQMSSAIGGVAGMAAGGVILIWLSKMWWRK